ncbi:MAG: PEP-CTERM sorting domain-containing protein [Tepidisphaeraceae bacterium]
MLRRFALGLCAAAMLSFASFASAQDDAASASPFSGPYGLHGGTGGGGPLDAAVLYTQTTQTGFRFTPGASTVTGAPIIALDDVPIPIARLAGGTAIAVNVTRVTYGVRQIAGAAAVTVTPYWTTMTTAPIAPDTEIDTPLPAPNPYAAAVVVPASAVSVTTPVVFGDGVTTMFTAPLNYSLFAGFGTIAVGMSLVDPAALNGWRITLPGPDANADVFWEYDAGNAGGTPPNPEGAFIFSTAIPPSPVAAFYLVIEGTLVDIPEPMSMALVGLGLSGLVLRRRR